MCFSFSRSLFKAFDLEFKQKMLEPDVANQTGIEHCPSWVKVSNSILFGEFISLMSVSATLQDSLTDEEVRLLGLPPRATPQAPAEAPQTSDGLTGADF